MLIMSLIQLWLLSLRALTLSHHPNPDGKRFLPVSFIPVGQQMAVFIKPFSYNKNRCTCSPLEPLEPGSPSAP